MNRLTNGSWSEFAEVLESLVAAGVHGIIVGGSTGEYDAQTTEERHALAAFAKDIIKTRTALIIGTGATRTEDSVPNRDLPTDRDPSFAKAFVDFQNDVLAKDIRLAVREGFRSVEHIKRDTTNGMAADQGEMSNVNGLAIAADALAGPRPRWASRRSGRPIRRPPSAASRASIAASFST